MIEHIQFLPVFLFSACIRNREKEGEIIQEQKKAQTWDLKLNFKQPQNIYNYTVCANITILPWIHPCTAKACKLCCHTEHSCKLSYGWREAEVLTMEAFSHITGVRATMTGSQSFPDGRRDFFFFSKSLAQVGTPCCCSGAKSNKPPKNGYGGKFPLIRGGSL